VQKYKLLSICLIANYHNIYFVFIIETNFNRGPPNPVYITPVCFGSDPDHKVFVRNNKSSLIQKTYIIPLDTNDPIILHAIIVKRSTARGGRITVRLLSGHFMNGRRVRSPYL